MAKPNRNKLKRKTLNNRSSKAVHSAKQKDRRQALATVRSQLMKVWYWLYIAYKIGSVVEFALNYWSIGI